jgi:hypothetical protein
MVLQLVKELFTNGFKWRQMASMVSMVSNGVKWRRWCRWCLMASNMFLTCRPKNHLVHPPPWYPRVPLGPLFPKLASFGVNVETSWRLHRLQWWLQEMSDKTQEMSDKKCPLLASGLGVRIKHNTHYS